MYAAEKGYQYVRVKTPDSDILWILMFHANKIKATVLNETGHGNKKRLLNITELSQHYVNKCDALLGLHAFTSCDVTSAFKRIGLKPLKKMLQLPTFCHALSQLGNSWTLSPGLVTGLEKFVCALFGKPNFDSVDDVRHFMLKVKCGGEISKEALDNTNVDFNKMPPDSESLEQRIRRANCITKVWKTAHNPSKAGTPKAMGGSRMAIYRRATMVFRSHDLTRVFD